MLHENPLIVLYFACIHLFPYSLGVCLCANTFNLCYFLVFSTILLPLHEFVTWILVIWALLRLLCCADFPNVDRFHYVASTTVCSLTSPLTTSPLTTAGELFKYWQQMWFPKFWFLLGGSNFITGNQYFKLIFLIWQAHSVTVLDNTCYIPKSELTWFITQSFFQGRMVFCGKSS